MTENRMDPLFDSPRKPLEALRLELESKSANAAGGRVLTVDGLLAILDALKDDDDVE